MAEIGLGTGNLHFTDSDPLPGVPDVLTTRAHDSLSTDHGAFGLGWTSALDAQVQVTGAKGSIASTPTVRITTESGRKLEFLQAGSSYSQIRPQGLAASRLSRPGSD